VSSPAPSSSPSSSRSFAGDIQRVIKQQEQKQKERDELKKKLQEPRAIIKAASDYAGFYNHPSYGDINVVASSDTFFMLFGNSNCSAPFIAGGPDSYVVSCDDPTELFPYPVPVQFTSDFSGAFTELLFGLELSVPFIPFTKSTFSAGLLEFPEFLPIEGAEEH